jgi:iron complex transport system substrate-binding protein
MLRLVLLLVTIAFSVPAQPARIVSTSPSITETLFSLGLGPQVVGVSTYCKYPPEALTLPKVGSYRKPDPERIALLRPDLVFLNATATDISNRLDALGIRHVKISPGSLAQTFQAMRAVGQATGKHAEAEALIRKIDVVIDRARSSKAPRRRALLIVGRDPDSLTGLVAAGPNSYLGELLAAAGGVNALQGDPLPAYPRISLETVMRADPDVIIDAAAMGDRPEENEGLRRRVMAAWQARSDLRAVKEERVYPVFSAAFTVPGPRMLLALEFLNAALEGRSP